MSNAIFAFVAAAQRANIDAAIYAIKPDYGPSNFTRALCAIDPNATYETPPTAYCMYDASATMQDAVVYQAARDGTLPTIDIYHGNPITWGENGVISEADAKAAFATLQFWVNASDVIPLTFAEANMTAAGLQFVPDPPL